MLVNLVLVNLVLANFLRVLDISARAPYPLGRRRGGANRRAGGYGPSSYRSGGYRARAGRAGRHPGVVNLGLARHPPPTGVQRQRLALLVT